MLGRVDYLSLCEAMYEERISGRHTDFMDDDGITVIARTCVKCDFIYTFDDFYVDSRGLDGKSDICKTCKDVKARKYQKSDKWKKYQREYQAKHEERIRKWSKQYHKDNPNISRAALLRRMARKKSLPDTLTVTEVEEVVSLFGGCFLTGADTYHIDHVIPLSSGCGGTTKENSLPLRGDLNSSKHDKNIFEWFEEVKERYGLSQERFDAGIAYIAELNGMSTEEYRNYVYECHEGGISNGS